jgi:hypothetical protein
MTGSSEIYIFENGAFVWTDYFDGRGGVIANPGILEV